MTILTHFTFESPIRKLCLRCCQSQLGIHFRTPLSGTWISRGKITAFLVAVLRSAFLHRESGDDSRFVFVKRLESLPSASCPPHDALHPGPQLSPSILKGATSEPLACAPRRDLTVKASPHRAENRNRFPLHRHSDTNDPASAVSRHNWLSARTGRTSLAEVTRRLATGTGNFL